MKLFSKIQYKNQGGGTTVYFGCLGHKYLIGYWTRDHNYYRQELKYGLINLGKVTISVYLPNWLEDLLHKILK